jgi:signal transduction histidine kinase
MYSRVGRQDLQMERVDLEHLVDDIVAQYPEFSKFVRVEKPLAAVMGSEALLTQCLSNLIGNAVKFTKPGELPEVRVRNELRDGFVRVWVEDKGIGIDPRYHQKIFAAFERVETSGAYEGTGIGLAIVQKGVERMGGQVGVVSEPGRGSAFWIELPRAEP